MEYIVIFLALFSAPTLAARALKFHLRFGGTVTAFFVKVHVWGCEVLFSIGVHFYVHYNIVSSVNFVIAKKIVQFIKLLSLDLYRVL